VREQVKDSPRGMLEKRRTTAQVRMLCGNCEFLVAPTRIHNRANKVAREFLFPPATLRQDNKQRDFVNDGQSERDWLKRKEKFERQKNKNNNKRVPLPCAIKKPVRHAQ
jgi:hypothetical protein